MNEPKKRSPWIWVVVVGVLLLCCGGGLGSALYSTRLVEEMTVREERHEQMSATFQTVRAGLPRSFADVTALDAALQQASAPLFATTRPRDSTAIVRTSDGSTFTTVCQSGFLTGGPAKWGEQQVSVNGGSFTDGAHTVSGFTQTQSVRHWTVDVGGTKHLVVVVWWLESDK
jgi:hypothetical protein